MAEPITADGRACATCKEYKPWDAYSRSPNTPSGRVGHCRPCKGIYDRARYARLREQIIAYNTNRRALNINGAHDKERATRQRLRDKLLDGFGAWCNCCGERNRRFLSLDHISGGGLKHIRERGSNTGVYRDAIAEGFPRDKYQILCYNCNLGRAHNTANPGVCPHKDVIREAAA